MPGPPRPLRVVPFALELGEAVGHRVDLLSLEVWDQWWDLRFARVATSETSTPLARRVPADRAWTITDDIGTTYEIVDAVGRGDRLFSNGEVRLRPTLAADATALTIEVDLSPGSAQPATIRQTVPLPIT